MSLSSSRLILSLFGLSLSHLSLSFRTRLLSPLSFHSPIFPLSLSVSLFVSVSLFLPHLSYLRHVSLLSPSSLSLSLPPLFSLSASLCLCLMSGVHISVCDSLSLCHLSSISPLSLCQRLYLSVSIYVCLSLSVTLSVCLSTSLSPSLLL